jgi:predicted nucleic acid-binding protein
MKLRAGHIEAIHRSEGLGMFSRLCSDTFLVLAVSGFHFRTAGRFADQHVLGLRAGDALHLAMCVDHGATLCTLDRRLGEAGSALGVKTMLL